MKLANVKVEIFSVRRKKNGEFPTTVRIRSTSPSGMVTKIMASAGFERRPVKGHVFPAQEVTLSEYVAKEGDYAGRIMHGVNSITE